MLQSLPGARSTYSQIQTAKHVLEFSVWDYFVAKFAKSRHHTTIPPPRCFTTYYIPSIHWKLSCTNLTQKNMNISMQGGTHATTINVVDHVSSRKDNLQLNSTKHSSSPKFKVEMTYVWIRWSFMKTIQ